MNNAAKVVSSQSTRSAPAVLSGVVPYVQVNGASAASELYQRAFGAVEAARLPVDESGRTMHIHLHINGGSVMLSDAYPEYGAPLQAPQAFNLMMQVDDIDAWFSRAVAAGAEVVMPVAKMFWGDRYGQLRDRFGVLWAMNQPE